MVHVNDWSYVDGATQESPAREELSDRAVPTNAGALGPEAAAAVEVACIQPSRDASEQRRSALTIEQCPKAKSRSIAGEAQRVVSAIRAERPRRLLGWLALLGWGAVGASAQAPVVVFGQEPQVVWHRVGTASELQAALRNGNIGTIALDPGVYEFDGAMCNHTGQYGTTTQSALCINRTVTIQADPGTVRLDAKGTQQNRDGRVFYITDGVVALIGLNITGGYVDVSASHS